MPKKRLTEAQRLKLLEDTKQRLRLELQARTETRLRKLEIEVSENLGRQLLTEPLELIRELNCPPRQVLQDSIRFQQATTKKTSQTKRKVRQL